MIKKPTTAEWHCFSQEEGLSQEQLLQFQQYCSLLITWNQKYNLTALDNEQDVIDFHFKDSLRLANIVDIATINHSVDVGTGAGFPGIPLVIKYPHLSATLIEVNAKKIKFLDEVITALGLGQRIAIFDQDWRTFLRASDDTMQLFLARASLQPEELIRMFRPACAFNSAQLVYWAAASWIASPIVVPYVVREWYYQIRNKKRKLVLLANSRIVENN